MSLKFPHDFSTSQPISFQSNNSHANSTHNTHFIRYSQNYSHNNIASSPSFQHSHRFPILPLMSLNIAPPVAFSRPPRDRLIQPLMSLNINCSSRHDSSSSLPNQIHSFQSFQPPVFSEGPLISKKTFPQSKAAELPVQPKRTLEELGIKLDHLNPEQQVQVRHNILAELL